jgi:Predicted metal-sulfur cluster biosynthetic enzyme
MVLKDDIILALKQVYDPEIPVNVYDLGLIYEIDVDEKSRVKITMTMTAPNCPMAEDVVIQVQDAAKDVPGVNDAEVKLVFEPQWTMKMMSDEAMLELGMM